MARQLDTQDYSASEIVDKRNTFSPLWLSLFPFVAGEYFTELLFVVFPSGVVFPIGYLLFWSFYYTYYRPGVLEDGLRDRIRFNPLALIGFILGIFVWFVKVSFVQVIEFIFFRRMRKAVPRKKVYSGQRTTYSYRPAPKPNGLPQDIVRALNTLGLGECRDWKKIHSNYRMLAKKYHPDLNPNSRFASEKFIEIDRAFHKLENLRSLYFH